jgi:hypothetical protein
MAAGLNWMPRRVDNEGTEHVSGDVPGEAMATSRRRQSREELRDLLLQAGGSILREEGLGTEAGTITFKKVFDRVEEETGIRLTNASVIRRVWRNQAEFQADVLVAIVLEGNPDEIDRTVGAVAPILADVDRSTPESRQRALRELCRVGGAANLEVMRRSGNWPMWAGIWALANSSEPFDYRKDLRDALASGYAAFNERIEEAYTVMASSLGFRLRETFTLRQFTIAADALGQGCGLRDRVDDAAMEGIARPTGPGGVLQEWTLFAIAFEGLVRQFFEIDPEWRPEGDAG